MTNTQSGHVRPEVEIDRMIDESGAYGVDWAGFSRELISRSVLSPARPRGIVLTAASQIQQIVRAVVTRHTLVPQPPGATPVDVAEPVQSGLQGE